MKKIFLCAALAASLTVSAEVLTPAQALMRLEQSSESQSNPAVRRMAARNVSAAMPVRTVSSDAGVPQLYLFADGNEGLMLLSAESEAESLIGYTDSYTPGDALPPALEYMMECYAAEIDALRAGEVTFSSTNAFNVNSPAISPICTTKWNQGAPYNALCPTLSGRTSVTGCVATAMAQVLKTYEYPQRCSGGSYSYSWRNGNKTLSLNFNDVELDWASMADSYGSNESAPEVAELMKAVGYAAQMNYSPDASGASGVLLAEGLVRNFDYDCTLSYECREWYPLAQWQQMVYDEIAGGHALYYDGANPDNTSGHAFVVDGYKSDGLFHLNWGWGGMSDGYFRLTALDPSAQGIGGSAAGYNRGQGAIFGLSPGATNSADEAPLVFFIQSDFKAAVTSAQLGTKVTFRGSKSDAGLYNNGPQTVKSVSPGVKFTKSTGEVFYFHDSSTIASDIPIYSGLYLSAKCLIDGLPEGDYQVTPAVYNPNTREYFDVRYSIGTGAVSKANVTGTTVTFTLGEIVVPLVQDFVIPDVLHLRTSFEISAKFVNYYEEEYHGPVYAMLLPVEEYSVAAQMGTVIVSVASGEEYEFSSYFKIDSTTLALGEYDAVLVDKNSTIISGRKRVTVAEQAPVGVPKCTSIRVTDKHQDQLTVSVKIKSQGGTYANPVYVVFTEYGKNESVAYYPSPMVCVENGATATVDVVCNFVEGVPGAKYTAYPFYLDQDNYLQQITGNAASFTLEEPYPPVTPEESVIVREFTAPSEATLDESFVVSAELTNNTLTPYVASLSLALYNVGQNTEIACLGSANVDIAVGHIEQVTFDAVVSNVEPGQYEIAILGDDGKAISDRRTITVNPAVEVQGTPQCSNITVTNTNKESLTFNFTLSSVGGPYQGAIYAAITEYQSTSIVAAFKMPDVVLDASGEETTIEMICLFDDGIPGATYTVYPFYELPDGSVEQIMGISASFTLDEDETAIENVETDVEDVEYYDLNGRRVANPKGGVYIRKQGGNVSKVKL